MHKFISNRPNIILITVDALRADHLGCYGYKLNTSPNLDRFAKEATLFTQAITQGTATAMSFPSLHTSTYPRTHGVYRMGHKLNNTVTTLAQMLKKHNYTTAAIVTWNIRELIPGLNRGFDFIADDRFDTKADEITKMAIAYLEKNQESKFFIWLHYFDTHAPYAPPPPYNRMFINDLDLGRRYANINYSVLYPGDMQEFMPKDKKNTVDVDYYISQYDGEIGFADGQIGILLRRIREMNLDEKSIIIITADHGEVLDEHMDRPFAHNILHDQVLKVPLLIKYKNIIPAAAIINQQVQSIDITPTILALAQISKDQGMQGKSLLPLIYGKSNNLSLDSFSESLNLSDNKSIEECVRADGWKLIYTKINNHEDYQLYNLNLDPDESTNLVATETEKFKFLQKKLDSWHKQIPLNEPEEDQALSEENKRILRSLGYLQ